MQECLSRAAQVIKDSMFIHDRCILAHEVCVLFLMKSG